MRATTWWPLQRLAQSILALVLDESAPFPVWKGAGVLELSYEAGVAVGADPLLPFKIFAIWRRSCAAFVSAARAECRSFL